MGAGAASFAMAASCCPRLLAAHRPPRLTWAWAATNRAATRQTAMRVLDIVGRFVLWWWWWGAGVIWLSRCREEVAQGGGVRVLL
jgi:hypothetical protein